MSTDDSFNDLSLVSEFIEEALERLDTVDNTLVLLEDRADDTEIINVLFRSIHSIKGVSSMLELHDITRVSHRMETLLDTFRAGEARPNKDTVDLLFRGCDVLKALIDELRGRVETANELGIVEGDERAAAIIAEFDNLAHGPKSGELAVLPPADVPSAEEVVAQLEATTEIEVESAVEPSPAPPEEVDEPLPNDEPMPEELRQDFFIEAKDHLDGIDEALLQFDSSDDQAEAQRSLFRSVHSLKGTSGYVGLLSIERVAHALESVLDEIRQRPGGKLFGDVLDLVFDATDVLKKMVAHAETGGDKIDPRPLLKRLRLEKERQASGVADAPAAAPVATANDPQKLFAASAAQHLATLRKCLRHTESSGEADPLFVEAGLSAASALKTAAEYLSLDKVVSESAMIVDSLQRVAAGALTLAGPLLSLLDDSLSVIESSIAKDLSKSTFATPTPPAIAPKPAPAKAAAAPVAAPPPKPVEPPKASAPLPAKPAVLKPAAVSPPVAPPQVAKLAPSAPPAPAVKAPPAPAVAAPKPPSPPAVPAAAKPIAASAPSSTPVPAAKPIEAPAKPVAAKAETAPASSEGPKTMRIDPSILDVFMNLVGELIVSRNAFGHIHRGLNGSELQREEALAEFNDLSRTVMRISRDMQQCVMEMRMIPVRNVFSKFPRMVRDIGKKSGKEVELILEGEDTEIDKGIAEEIADPLVHLVRNAVDHGIESPERRKAAGKPAKGSVTLRAGHAGNNIVIDIIDDGGGIDPARILAKAIEKGLCTPELGASLSKEQILDFIFAPGFSTAATITDISGRGVGMDVVRTNIRRVKGNISINSEVGQGSTMRLELPLTMAVIEALLVKVRGNTYALPIHAVSETVKAPRSAFTSLMDKQAILLRGEIVGVSFLADLLELPQNGHVHEPLDEIPIVLLNTGTERLGLAVDALNRPEEIVVKPLPDYLAAIPGLAGASILGDGRAILILDPMQLVALVQRPAAGALSEN